MVLGTVPVGVPRPKFVSVTGSNTRSRSSIMCWAAPRLLPSAGVRFMPPIAVGLGLSGQHIAFVGFADEETRRQITGRPARGQVGPVAANIARLPRL